MKKSQRARLAELVEKDPATLTPEEQKDLAHLRALAEENKDESKDVDDSEEVEKKKKDDEAAAQAAAPLAHSPGLGAAIASVINAARTRVSVAADLTAARAEIATAKANVAKHAAAFEAKASEAAGLSAQLTAANARLATVCGFFGLKADQIAAKAPTDVVAELEKRIAAAASAQLATAGVATFAASTVTADPAKVGAAATVKTYAEFSALTPGEKKRFCLNGGKIVD